MEGPSDLLERLWGLLFVGDAPGNRVLLSDSAGRCAVIEHVPDGGSRRRDVRVGDERLTVDVPTFAEQLAADGAGLPEVVEELQRHSEEQQPGQAANRARFLARRAAEDARTVRCSRPLGHLDAWLRSQPDPDGFLTRVADGRDHRCQACQGTGHLVERCDRCAGSGVRRSAGTLIVLDEHGGRCKLDMDASKVELVEDTIIPPANSGRGRWINYLLSVTHLASELTRAGVVVPAGPQVLLQAGMRTVSFGGTRSSYEHAGPDGVARAFLRFLPAGVRPDLAPQWLTPAARQLAAAECRFDRLGRAAVQQVRLRPVRPLTAAWAELVDHAAALEALLPHRWRVQVWLSTGFIATGQHGPQIRLVASPPEVAAPSIEAVGTIDGSLGNTVETIIGQIRTTDLDHLAHDVRQRGETGTR